MCRDRAKRFLWVRMSWKYECVIWSKMSGRDLDDTLVQLLNCMHELECMCTKYPDWCRMMYRLSGKENSIVGMLDGEAWAESLESLNGMNWNGNALSNNGKWLEWYEWQEALVYNNECLYVGELVMEWIKWILKLNSQVPGLHYGHWMCMERWKDCNEMDNSMTLMHVWNQLAC
jgi:hypothetical protein